MKRLSHSRQISNEVNVVSGQQRTKIYDYCKLFSYLKWHTDFTSINDLSKRMTMCLLEAINDKT